MKAGTISGAGNLHKTSTRWLVGALSLLVISLSGCTQKEAGTGAAPSTSGSSTSESSSGAPSANKKTSAEAVTSFVTMILRKQYAKACLENTLEEDMPEKELEEKCKSPEMKEAMGKLRGMWAKPGVKLPPKAKVQVIERITENGNDASVPDSVITLDGRTLRELELIGSSGNTESFSLSLKLRKHEDTWYVNDWSIEF